MNKDLGRGPTDPSPESEGAKPPNDRGINGHPPPIPRPLAGRTTYSRINFDALAPIVRPARGRMKGVGCVRSRVVWGIRPSDSGLGSV